MRIHSLRLPFEFDPSRLREDLSKIRPEEWIAHYNAGDYEGEWSGVALRSGDGSVHQLYAGMSGGVFLDTPLLERCGYFSAVLAAFPFPMRAVRLLRLHSGSRILEHSDPALGFEDGEIRLHMPIQTSTDVHFYLDGRRVNLQEGETWYLDLSRPHRVENRGAGTRVHLVIDGLVNDWVRAVFAAVAARQEPPTLESEPVERTPFERFREKVFEDPRLQSRLLAVPEQDDFARLAVELGRKNGFSFSEADVASAIRAGKRAWIERWIEA